MRQRVAISGASGLIGSALSSYLQDRGDEVIRLVRRPARSASEVTWDPARHELDPAALKGVTAVVHLSGAGIADKRWTAAYKKTLLTSRTDTTSTLADAIASSSEPIRLVSGSAIGFYGDRGDEVLTEASSHGEGFLSDLVQQWEAATAPAVEAGAPTAIIRSGLVFDPKGGVLGKVLPLARLRLGGPLGSGQQWWSWISITDHVRAVAHLIDHPDITGPVNLVAPEPQRQKDVMGELGRQLRRPSFLPAPKAALRVAVGEAAQDVLSSQRVQPKVLQDNGFEWQHPDLESAFRWILTQ